MAIPNFTQGFVAGLIFIWLVLWLGHWLPWPQFIGRKLPRVAAYTYGSVTVLIAFTLWQWGNWQVIIGLTCLYFMAGIVTVAAYKLDDIGSWLASRRRVRNGANPQR